MQPEEQKEQPEQTPPPSPEPGRPATSLPEAKAITRARARDLRTLLAKYVGRHLPPVTPTQAPEPEPPRVVGSYARLLPLLATIPWGLTALFALSFAWDFDGVVVTLFGYRLALEGLILTLSVSGLIGFITNWLAITMLFHPREARPVFGQGLIPAQRARVIYRLAKAVSEELINEKIIKEKIEASGVIPKYRAMALGVTRGVLEDPDFRADLKVIVADYVETVLASEPVRQKLSVFLVEKLESYAGEGLGGLALRAYRFFGEPDFQRRVDQAIRQLPGALDPALEGLDHLLDRVPEKIEARSDEIEAWVTKIVLGFVEKLDVYDMVVTNMERYDDQRLEALIKNASNEQLNYIKYLGGVLGVLGGFFIWKPLASLLLFGTLGGLLWGLDALLYRRRDSAKFEVRSAK